MSAIYILWLRELKRYTRSRAQILASLGNPLLYLLVLGFGLGPVFERAGNGNYLQFVAPGVIGMTVLFSSVFSGLGLLWDRQFGFLKETLVAPVSRLQIMIGRTLPASPPFRWPSDSWCSSHCCSRRWASSSVPASRTCRDFSSS
jgi:ABC-2 type transport system permease protein